jgi:hypothetical protein
METTKPCGGDGAAQRPTIIDFDELAVRLLHQWSVCFSGIGQATLVSMQTVDKYPVVHVQQPPEDIAKKRETVLFRMQMHECRKSPSAFFEKLPALDAQLRDMIYFQLKHTNSCSQV